MNALAAPQPVFLAIYHHTVRMALRLCHAMSLQVNQEGLRLLLVHVSCCQL